MGEPPKSQQSSALPNSGFKKFFSYQPIHVISSHTNTEHRFRSRISDNTHMFNRKGYTRDFLHAYTHQHTRQPVTSSTQECWIHSGMFLDPVSVHCIILTDKLEVSSHTRCTHALISHRTEPALKFHETIPSFPFVVEALMGTAASCCEPLSAAWASSRNAAAWVDWHVTVTDVRVERGRQGPAGTCAVHQSSSRCCSPVDIKLLSWRFSSRAKTRQRGRMLYWNNLVSAFCLSMY